MVVLNGYFDGNQVVFDDPLPDGIGPNTRVRVIFDAPKISGEDALAKIASMAVPADLPADFSQQHDHYVRGTARR
jgi:hypothetical protein